MTAHLKKFHDVAGENSSSLVSFSSEDSRDTCFHHAVSKLNRHTKTFKHPTCHKLTMQEKPMKVYGKTGNNIKIKMN